MLSHLCISWNTIISTIGLWEAYIWFTLCLISTSWISILCIRWNVIPNKIIKYTEASIAFHVYLFYAFCCGHIPQYRRVCTHYSTEIIIIQLFVSKSTQIENQNKKSMSNNCMKWKWMEYVHFGQFLFCFLPLQWSNAQ